MLAIETAAAWLRSASGCTRLVGLGLGLGGLLALQALEGGASFDELILWAVPGTGRAFVRGARTFSRLQAWQAPEADTGHDSGLPDGYIEASGFVLSAETISALESLRPEGASSSGLRRALVIGRHSGQTGGALAKALEGGGTDVQTAPGKGFGSMTSHPERSRLPGDVVDRVETWLAEGDALALEPASAAEPGASVESEDASTELRLDVGGRTVIETPFRVELPFGRTFGVLSQPSESASHGLCGVFLNAGAVRDTGPNRMWVERSRAWAAKGVPSLRLDLEALGEADGDPDGVPPGEEFFAAKYELQAKAVLEALREEGLGPEFVLVGLCSGAYFAYRTALNDERVRAALLINPGAFVWRPNLLDERETRKASRLFQRQWVKKLLFGEVSWRKLDMLMRSLWRRTTAMIRRTAARRGRHAWEGQLREELDQLRERGTRLVIAFSGGEPTAEELDAAGIPSELGRWPNVEMRDLPGEDHTLRPIAGQAALRDLLDSRLEREIERPPTAATERLRPSL